MLKAILVGVLNVIIPGAGLACLKKWGMAVAYFFAVPLFLVFALFSIGTMTGYFADTVQEVLWIASPAVFATLYFVVIVYIVWESFITPFKIARGEALTPNVLLATALSVLVPGLGFVHLKRWGWAFGYIVWASGVLIVGGIIIDQLFRHVSVMPGIAPIIANNVKVLIAFAWILLFVFVAWDSGRATYKTAKEILAAESTS
ncbi:MAG: hypothetical protein AB1750_00860 [Chloroflexota bacterium]